MYSQVLGKETEKTSEMYVKILRLGSEGIKTNTWRFVVQQIVQKIELMEFGLKPAQFLTAR